ncbi:hypothetical protein COU15_02415 [Candidatus Kaiserbacteria bacterium CG10_big_fil_rev_8_21_14_0_10_45_20]|uniref:Uncharacterized protein n=1 Tax=Candidatus Kaiserbacteria bacterium CG10_big_fil_rev_8_21_14_0_10_45_20 TaxID=1974607 RepID=A0A2H0UFU3_9BACT|nr:MAG: hypothetical protein COU15_02415 [Candidatus Kaiserbacteria bacterium CG10_big_fil_rev_8_21_14_0_10_45_20]
MKAFKLSKSPDTTGAEETKKCHQCLADIPQEARKCSHCGSRQKTQITKRQSIITGIVIAVFVFIVISAGAGGENTSQQQSGVSDSQTHIMAQNYVKQVLKSPSTADFSMFDYRYVDLGDGRHKVTSYVDAQNSFGAEVRSDYSVILSYNGGDWADIRNWTLRELIFDGEVVYSEE